VATLRIPAENRTLTDAGAIAKYLATSGIDYEQWSTDRPLSGAAPAEEVLQAYATEIEKLKTRGGYVTADLIDVSPATPGLEAMLRKFSSEHWHDEDEVRFVISGAGVFHLHLPNGPIVAIEVGSGDLIRIPQGTLHWFDLCADRRIRAIRLFQDVAGWTPHYTGSGEDKNYLPLCFGVSHIPLGAAMKEQ
jgi:1,2-dihydroxy-3-keto-5-methylthiopentene dioxygenase